MSGNYENQVMSSASFEVHYKMDKDFKTVEMHSHDFFEVYCFLRGSASYIIEECKYTLLPGDILLIPQGKLHQLDIKDSTETYERYVLWINSKYIKKISSQKTDLRTCFECALKSKSFLIRNGAISQKIRRLLESITLSKEDAFGTDVENEERIKSLLVTLAQFFLQNDEATFAYGTSNACVRRAIDYIARNIDKNLSLDTIADALFVNKYYLAHVFKETTNTSPHRYILKKRLVLSKQLLEKGHPATEVYQKCGFTDYTHFFRAFKNEFGITPKQFVKSLR